MKTLVKPLVKLNTEVYLNQSYPQHRLKSNSLQHRKFHTKWKFLIVAMSLLAFLAFSDSPEIDGEICNKFNNEQVCNIW